MGKADRDPLFFPPARYPEDVGEMPEEYSAEVDTTSQEKRLRAIVMLALIFGVGFVASRSAGVRTSFADLFARLHITSARSASTRADASRLHDLPPQRQMESLLDMAIQRVPGSLDLISQDVAGWHGAVHADNRLREKITQALSSDDLRVREAAVEIELAAFDVPLKTASVDKYIAQAAPGHDRRDWALWLLGLLGNRGIESERVRVALLDHVHDPQEDIRYWAVESLALLGQDESIPPLLEVLHNDPSPKIRERAACGLAQSGLFTHQQRLAAVPQLLQFTEDSALDSATRGWIFQALREITGQQLPDSPIAWRKWQAQS